MWEILTVIYSIKVAKIGKNCHEEDITCVISGLNDAVFLRLCNDLRGYNRILNPCDKIRLLHITNCKTGVMIEVSFEFYSMVE